MTTPERFRRRQRIEEAVLLVLAALMVLQTAFFHNKSNEQQKCFERKIDLLTTTLTVRSTASERDSAAINRVILDVANADTQQQVAKALKQYRREHRVIQEDRAAHPVPPFPPGACSQ